MGGIAFTQWRVAIIAITIVVIVASGGLLTMTSFGVRVLAALENPALAGLAGALVVPIFSLFADLGLRFLIQAFLGVMLGGLGTFPDRWSGLGDRHPRCYAALRRRSRARGGAGFPDCSGVDEIPALGHLACAKEVSPQPREPRRCSSGDQKSGSRPRLGRGCRQRWEETMGGEGK